MPGVSATVTAGASLACPSFRPRQAPTPPTGKREASTFVGAPAPATTTLIAFQSDQGLVTGTCGGVLIDFVSVLAGAGSTPPLPPDIDPVGALPDAGVGVFYSYHFSATGDPTITWDIAGGALPAGLTLSPTGLLSGTPTTIGMATRSPSVPPTRQGWQR